MNITTKKAEQTEGTSYYRTGIGEFKVIAINPTTDKLNKLLGREAKDTDKEIEYLYEKDGKDHVKIAFWVEDVVSKWKTKIEFDITDEPATTKNGNPIHVNCLGDNAKVPKEAIQAWFKEFYKSKDDKTVIGTKEYRQALSGEAELYGFMRAWMSRTSPSGNRVDWFNPECNILLDMKKLFRGKFDQITDLFNAPEDDNITGTVVCACYVDSYDKDGQVKYAQKVWPYYFVAGWNMKKFNLAADTNTWMADAASKKLYEQLNGEYGIKKGFIMGKLQAFDPKNHVEATNEVIHYDTTTPVDDLDY